MFHRRRSLFPIIIGVLTIALVIFMVYAFSGKQSEDAQEFTTSITSTPKVTADDYRQGIREVVISFEDELAAKENDLGRLAVVEKTLGAVLEQRVPTEFRDFHLELAFAFSRMGSDLRGESEGDPAASFAQDLAAYRALVSATPWLR